MGMEGSCHLVRMVEIAKPGGQRVRILGARMGRHLAGVRWCSLLFLRLA